MDEEIHDFYKALLSFRKKTPVIAYGEFEVLRSKKDTFTYKRKLDGKEIIVDCNLGTGAISSYNAGENYKVVFESGKEDTFDSYGFRVWENC